LDSDPRIYVRQYQGTVLGTGADALVDGLLAGVHPSLVTFWFYEADIPLMERNYTDDSLEQIQAGREPDDGS
jgi:hypothetical protein